MALAGLSACSTAGKQTLVKAALHSEQGRTQSFEAVLRVLDQHPDWVDQFYQAAQPHKPTLDRFVKNAAEHLDEPDLAKTTAGYLSDNPSSLREILVQTIVASRGKPKARAAIARAVYDQRDTATDILTDDPQVVEAALLGTVAHVLHKPAARAAFEHAMGEASPDLAKLIARDPALVKKMMSALFSQLKEHPKVAADVVRELFSGKQASAKEGPRAPSGTASR